MTETELRAAGMDYRKVYTHQNGHAAYYPGTAPLFVKVLFDPGRRQAARVRRCWAGTASTSASTCSRSRCAPA